MLTTLFVIIALSVLIFIHELGHFSAAKIFRVKVLEFGMGFPPKLWGKRKGETEYTVNALPFGGFVRILGEDGEEKETAEEHAEEEKDPKRSFVFQPLWKKVVMLGAGVFMNFVLGWILMSIVFMAGIPEHLIITGTQPDSPAAEKGLQTGDIVISAVSGGEALRDPIKANDFIGFTDRAKGATMKLEIDRKGERIEAEMFVRENPPAGEGALGVYLADGGFPRQSFFASLGKGAEETWTIARLVFDGFVDLVKRVFTHPGSATENLAGPVGIVVVAKETSALGIPYFLQLMALISINLGVLNLLPVPALDGGRILLALIERAKGSPVSRNVQIAINAVGFILLIGLMVLVTVQDVRRLF
jgi:regulator of sigma E protease